MDCDSSERREKIVAGMRTEGVHLGVEIVIVIVMGRCQSILHFRSLR